MIPIEEINEKIKQMAKTVIKSIWIKVLIIAIILLLIFSAFTWFTTQDEGIWKKDSNGKGEKGNPSTYTKSTEISAQDGINVKKEDLIKNIFLSMGFTEEEINALTDEDIIRILGMQVKLGRLITSLDECTEAELLWCANDAYSKYLKTPEDLQKLLDAELITQYPKIEGLSEDKLNGIIKFERYQTDPDTEVETKKELTYIDSAEFTNKFNAYQQTGNEDIFNYFTLNENGDVKIATWTREEGSYYSNNTTSQTDRKKIRSGVTDVEIKGNYDERYNTNKNDSDSIEATYTTYYIKEEVVPYKTMVQKYTLPFEYLWSLLVIGKDDEFVLQLAELAYDSEITIGIFDNINKQIVTNEESYTEDFKERYELYEDGSLIDEYLDDGEWLVETHSYIHKNVITTYYDSIQMEVIYADTWSVKVITEYQNAINETEDFNDVNNLPDEEWQDDGYIEDHWDDTDTLEDGTEESTHYCKFLYKDKRTINKVNASTQITTKSNYQKTSTISEGKIDKDEANGKNFVNLLLKSKNALTSFQNPSNVNWLESILLANEDTKGMIDLTKYLIYQATGNENFNTKFNFNVYNTSSFNNIGTIYGETVQEKVWFALIDAGYSEYAAAGALGNIEEESGFNTMCVQGDWKQPDPMQYDLDYTNKVNSGEITEDEFVNHGPNGGGYGLIQWTSSARKSGLYRYRVDKGVDINDADMQINYLLGELSGKGDASSYTTRRTRGYIKSEGIIATHDDWANATSVDDATLQYMRFFESPGSKSSLPKRQAAAQKYYDMFHGKEKPEVGGEGWTTQGVSCPRYYQSNQPWSNYPYKYKDGGTISSGGCGACALAMAVSGLTKQEVTPLEIVQYLNSIGTDTVNNGAKSAQAVANKYGLTYSQISRSNKAAIDQALDEGKCLIFSIKANGIYTGNGHFIMCYGRNQDNYFVLESGRYYVQDRGYAFNQVFTQGNQGVFVLGK